MTRKYLHIGLGKTGTTALQEIVFPFLAKSLKLRYFDVSSKDLVKLKFCRKFNLDEGEFSSSEDCLVSWEGLVGWDPGEWLTNAEKNLNYFDKNFEIIITVRNPAGYLNSAYIQRSLHEGNMRKPEEFFLSGIAYNKSYDKCKFSVEDFSLLELIGIYSRYFKQVHIIKIDENSLSDRIFDIFGVSINSDKRKIHRLITQFEKVKRNRSFSDKAVRFSWFIDNLLAKFGLMFIGNEYINYKKGLEELLKIEDNNSLTSFTNNSYKKRRLFSWRFFINKIFDKIIPYKKFSLNLESYGFNLVKLSDEYKSINLTYMDEGK